MASKRIGQAPGETTDPSKKRASSNNSNDANRVPVAGPQLSSNEPTPTSPPSVASSHIPQDPSLSRHAQKLSTFAIPDQHRAALRPAETVRQASSPSRIPTSAAASASTSNVQVETGERGANEPPTSNAGSKRSGPSPDATKGPSSSTQDQATGSDNNRPRWPVPQRLKSPPPTYTRQSSNTASKRTGSESDPSEQTQSVLATPRANQDSQNLSQEHTLTTSTAKSPASPTQQAAAPLKIPRGFSGIPTTLETVEEGDQSTPPSNNSATNDAPGREASGQPSTSETPDSTAEPDKDKGKESPKMPDVASDPERSKSNLSRPRVQSVGPSPTIRKPVSRSSSPDGKQGTDGTSNRMIAETETVTSIPQTVVSTAAAADRTNPSKKEDSGTIKQKSNTESVKPKRDRKRLPRKPASIISGTGSTKADLFEAKVNSAVDEDTSDSDETFVYESNPPELKHRPARHHSRTPSVTSVQSLGNQRTGLRGIDGVLNPHLGVRGKRSMKFASSSYASSGVESESEIPSTKKSHHHHPKVQDRQQQHRGADKPASNPTQDSPFSQASRIRNASKPSSRTPSQTRTYGAVNGSDSPTKKLEYSSPYHSGGEQVNDEQAPLMGSVRTHRNHTRRPHHTLHRLHHGNGDYEGEPGHGQPKRRLRANFCGCLFVAVILILILCGVSLVVGTTKPLVGVKVLEIQNLLASEQEIMLDLLVEAVNPNVVSISISDMDVNIFAKSSHIKSIYEQAAALPERRSRSRHGSLRGRRRAEATPAHLHEPAHEFDGIDEGTDPIDDEPPSELDPATMLLGRVFEFDSALTFEASPVAQLASNSSGELRLVKPGNMSETGGSKRWERVLKYDFELIVRGILKYQLPLSTRFLTAPVQGRIQVHPQNTSLLFLPDV